MRLLNTTTLKLHEFIGDSIPEYAILSHRWENEEVSFQDLQAGLAPQMAGYSKIKDCCDQAVRDGWEYAWIDSCCIDKTSSAELSEAINSMFKWYEDSQICYAYLSDVPGGEDAKSHHMRDSKFRGSKWFTRGWTLQELLAPSDVVFYDHAWSEIGTKWYLEGLISNITRVSHFGNFRTASVAQKMSWASHRKTTRIEDQAYSLMGLFGVNMPPLYGEGHKAFERLQLEILKISDDESLFAWEYSSERWEAYYNSSLLAYSPSAFAKSHDIVTQFFDRERPSISVTNQGLRLEIFLAPGYDESTFLAPLNCSRGGDPIAISLRRAHRELTSQFWRKGQLHSLTKRDLMSSIRTVLFVRQLTLRYVSRLQGYYPFTFVIVDDSLLRTGFHVFEELGLTRDDYRCLSPTKRAYIRNVRDYGRGKGRFILEDYNVEGFLDFKSEESGNFVLHLRADEHKKTVSVDIFIPEKQQTLTELYPVLMNKIGTVGRSDRISRTMKSGKSVSVAVKRGMESGEICFVLDINIDPSGNLPWPEVEPSLE